MAAKSADRKAENDRSDKALVLAGAGVVTGVVALAALAGRNADPDAAGIGPAEVVVLAADAGHTLVAYVDGRPVTGNPASIRLAAHQEIALVYGAAGGKVTPPAGYDFTDE